MGRVDKAMLAYIQRRLTAADSGEAEALYDMGLLYSTGQGVDFDTISAHKWFNLAALKGVGRAVVDRAEIAADMNSWEVAEAQKQAREWLECH